MTVFYDRGKATYKELSGELYPLSGQFNMNLNKGYSGGQLPSRKDVRKKYTMEQTTSVVNIR